MKKLKLHFVIAVLLLITAYSCNGNDVNTPGTSSIELVLYKSNGCTSTAKTSDLSETTDDAIIEASYKNGYLIVNLYFTTLCSAEMKDSVVVNEELIDIYLKDTNPETVRCVCPHKEEFLFAIGEMKEVEIKFSYQGITSTEYHELADTTITIN